MIDQLWSTRTYPLLVTAVREGRLELPRPLGHRILRLLATRTKSGSTSRPVSSDVLRRLRVSSCREQIVSKRDGKSSRRQCTCACRREESRTLRGMADRLDAVGATARGAKRTPPGS